MAIMLEIFLFIRDLCNLIVKFINKILKIHGQ